MSNKGPVEDYLSEFFEEESCSSPTINIIIAAQDWITNRQKSFQNIIDEISPTDEEDPLTSNLKIEPGSVISVPNVQNVSDSKFEQLFRMTKSTFTDLQNELEPNCKEFNTNLLLCLWVLGNTKSFGEITQLIKIKEDVLFEICETFMAKIIELSPKYVYWPSPTEVMSIEKGFFADYKFPGVVGVIGSLHIAVHVSPNEPNASKYYNKTAGNHTIVLQAVCDNNLLFRDIFAGYPGSNSIATILKASSLFPRLTDVNSLLTKTKKHLLGGTEHPQLPTLLTPYTVPKNRKSTERELKFNALHGSVMYTVEKTFRMVENRFQRMKSLDTANPKFATLAAGAICTLHNFCRLRNDTSGCS